MKQKIKSKSESEWLKAKKTSNYYYFLINCYQQSTTFYPGQYKFLLVNI